MQVSLMLDKGEKNYRAHPVSCRRENLMQFYHKALSKTEISIGRKDRIYRDDRLSSVQRSVDKKDSQPEGDINGVLYARETE